GGRRAALEPPPRGALPRPRAAGPTGGSAAAREARRPRCPDPASAGRAVARDRGSARGGDERPRHRLRRALGARAGGFPRARPPLAQTGALRPAQPRALRAREPRLLSLHEPDPPLPGPRRPPRAPPRARRGRRGAARPRRPCRAHLGARARGCGDRVPRRRDLPRLAARARAVRARLGRALAGRDHRRDPERPLRSLRRGLRGLPASTAPPRRLLRAERGRHVADRPPRRAHLPARRPDRGRRRGDPAMGRQGGALAGRRRVSREPRSPRAPRSVAGERRGLRLREHERRRTVRPRSAVARTTGRLPPVPTAGPARPIVEGMPIAVAYALSSAPFLALGVGLLRLTRA